MQHCNTCAHQPASFTSARCRKKAKQPLQHYNVLVSLPVEHCSRRVVNRAKWPPNSLARRHSCITVQFTYAYAAGNPLQHASKACSGSTKSSPLAALLQLLHHRLQHWLQLQRSLQLCTAVNLMQHTPTTNNQKQLTTCCSPACQHPARCQTAPSAPSACA